MSDTPTGETVNVEPPKNDATPPVQPAVVKTEDNNAVEELRKKLEQQEMRNNQLANQLKAKEDAEAAAQTKQLEEQNQYKELFEQEKAKREAIEQEREEADRKAAVDKAKSDVLSEYSDDVKALAKEVGISLDSSDEAAVAAFKEKLDKINSRVANTATVTGNNNRVQNKPTELNQDELRATLGDEQKFHDMVTARFPGIAQMTKKQ